ncbi:hypothetical protein [Ethanoligenens harbinense]|uniref:hypothetical protein n=1 Tax=Ethanoligenens harbinense TaxID=253239 RepID=UPI0010BFD5F0|nr:hypothetical protein [Ethanoligenens harbinense]
MAWIKIIVPFVILFVVLFFALPVWTKRYSAVIGCAALILSFGLQVLIVVWNINQGKTEQFLKVLQSSQHEHILSAEKTKWNSWLSKAQADVRSKGEWSFYSYKILQYEPLH